MLGLLRVGGEARLQRTQSAGHGGIVVQSLEKLLDVLVALGMLLLLLLLLVLLLLHEEVLVQHMLLGGREMRMRMSWLQVLLLLLLLGMWMRIGQSVGRRCHQVVRR